MYKVEGIILVKETQAPIPNLQVVLYDLDSRKAKPDLASHLSPPSSRTQSHFWQQLQGDRIGSIRTDSRGAFAFEFDRKDFQAPAQEERPDLLLFVLAPEDTVSEQSSLPRPSPPNERLLYYSYEPITNSGKHESYVIRMSRKRLDELGIPYPSSSSNRAPIDVETIEEDLKKSATRRIGINAALTEQIREKAKPVIALKKKVDDAFTNFSLSSVPDNVRSGPTYLNAEDDLKKQQDQLVNEALIDIPRLEESAGVQRKIKLTLTKAQLEDLGLSLEDDGSVRGEVEASTLLRHVSGNLTSTTLEFSADVLGDCRASLEAERLFREALARCGAPSEDNGSDEPGSEGDGSVDSGDLTTEAFVREHVTRQTRHVTAPEVELAYGVERDGEITATITRPGPADVTAYHDFHDLQIAFDYIWKEAFDGTIMGPLKNLYAEVVRYANQISGLPQEVVKRLEEQVTSVDDMQRLYDDVRLLQELIEDAEETDIEEVDPMPYSVYKLFQYTRIRIEEDDWRQMNDTERDYLRALAKEYLELDSTPGHERPLNAPAIYVRLRNDAVFSLRQARGRIRQEVSSRRPVARRRPTRLSRLRELMIELDERLSERFKFDIFAPNSVNYGIMLTYRQAWTPKDYQVGDLVSTIPLAPKEVRRYSKKRVIKKSRTQKELEDSQSSRRSETSSTARADSEIVKRANNKTSFQQTAEGTLSLGVFEGKFGTQFGIDAEKASSSTKKNFREAVSKAAEEYKQQHRLEVETSTSEEHEFTDSGEISNPNDEITVTYLFYELQRQYEVREQIHRLTPVIMVANEVPEPHEIDEDWLIAHHWILRRVILDDVYLPALDYVTTSFVGDEMALEVMWTNLQRQARLVDDAAEHMNNKSKLAQSAFDELKRLTGLIEDTSHAQHFANVNLAAAFGPFALVGLLGNDNDAAEKREEVAKIAIERADKDEQEASARLSREVTALQKAIDQYTSALREHLDRQTAVTALRIHIKENILCYMHAIWDYECGDQRYFRLYNVEVPWVEIEDHANRLSTRVHGKYAINLAGRDDLIHLEGEISLSHTRIVSRKLSQVADLDNLLGYKGNYMIFPVKEPNHLHWYMMQDYIDPQTGGLRDPDEYANYTTEDLLDYACCLKKTGLDEFDDRLDRILDLLKERKATPRKESELIVVPTDSLYIEALPGKHPILEDFKLVHRAIDVKKVQAEVRREELENVRLAARLLEEEREDPDIDKKIVIEGGDDIIVPPEA